MKFKNTPTPREHETSTREDATLPPHPRAGEDSALQPRVCGSMIFRVRRRPAGAHPTTAPSPARVRSPRTPGSPRPNAAARPLRPAARALRVCSGHPRPPARAARTPTHPTPAGRQGRGVPWGRGPRTRLGSEGGVVAADVGFAAPGQRAAWGAVGLFPAWEGMGAPAREDGRRETAAAGDSDPGRAGPRRSAAATRSLGERHCASQPAPPPACPRRPEEGRRPSRPVRATSPPRRRARATPSAPGGGGGWAARAAECSAQPSLRPGRAGPAASARALHPQPARRGGGPGLTSVSSAGSSVPGRSRGPGARSPGEAPRRWRPLRLGGRAEREPLPGPRAVRSSPRAAGACSGGRSQLGPRTGFLH